MRKLFTCCLSLITLLQSMAQPNSTRILNHHSTDSVFPPPRTPFFNKPAVRTSIKAIGSGVLTWYALQQQQKLMPQGSKYPQAPQKTLLPAIGIGTVVALHDLWKQKKQNASSPAYNPANLKYVNPLLAKSVAVPVQAGLNCVQANMSYVSALLGQPMNVDSIMNWMEKYVPGNENIKDSGTHVTMEQYRQIMNRFFCTAPVQNVNDIATAIDAGHPVLTSFSNFHGDNVNHEVTFINYSTDAKGNIVSLTYVNTHTGKMEVMPASDYSKKVIAGSAMAVSCVHKEAGEAPLPTDSLFAPAQTSPESATGDALEMFNIGNGGDCTNWLGDNFYTYDDGDGTMEYHFLDGYGNEIIFYDNDGDGQMDGCWNGTSFEVIDHNDFPDIPDFQWPDVEWPDPNVSAPNIDLDNPEDYLGIHEPLGDPDPCNETTKAQAAKATGTFALIAQPQTWLATLPTQTIEHSFSLQQTWVPPAYGEKYGHYNYSVPAVSNGSGSSSVTQVDDNTIAMGHSHPPLSSTNPYAAPSATDVYGLLTEVGVHPDLTLSFVLTADGTKYALQVSDPAAAAAFLQQYPQSANENPTTHMFLEGSLLSDQFKDIMFYYEKIERLATNEAYEKTLVQMLSQSGLSMQKADPGSNQFYTLVPTDKCTATNDTQFATTKCN